MADIPRLIGRAFPLKQTSLNSVHEKNVRHVHILTLHIWPARRPLAVCWAETGDIEVSAKEWAKACNMGQRYWLYAIYDCSKPRQRLIREQDPFGNLPARAKGSMLISPCEIAEATEH